MTTTKHHKTLFAQGRLALEQHDLPKAVQVFKLVLEDFQTCADAWNNLGVAYCQLRAFPDALNAYHHIDSAARTQNTWYNIALTHFYCRKYDESLSCLQQSLLLDPSYFAALDLRGRVYIEQENYRKSIEAFQEAFTSTGNLQFLLWEVYALYLFSEFTPDLDDHSKKRLLHQIIKRLERIESFNELSKDKHTQQLTLYFLGCAYSRHQDYSTAIMNLAVCIEKDKSTAVARTAKVLLDQVWNNHIKPPWWKWWLQAPKYLGRTIKRCLFASVFLLFVAMLLFFIFHPFINMAFPSIKITPDWSVLLFVAGLLLAIIVSPSVEQIRTKELEVKVYTPTSIDPFPASAQWESHIGAMQEMREKMVRRVETPFVVEPFLARVQ